MRFRAWSLLVALVLVIQGFSAPAATAAPASRQSELLCAGAPCSLDVDPWIREGMGYEVIVRGVPATRAQVRAYRAITEGAELKGFEPITDPVDFYTDRRGFARARLVIAVANPALAGGWALISMGDVTGTDTTTMLGVFVPLGGRRPIVLGDGYGAYKPVGETLDLQVVGAIPGTLFAVDVQDDTGNWQDATPVGEEPRGASRPDEITHVPYVVPRGLTAKPHAVRLRNVTDRSQIHDFHMIPAPTAAVQDRLPRFTPPPVGVELGQGSLASRHPVGVVRGVGVGLAVVAVAGIAASDVRFASRRRRWSEAIW